jgi:hypothetical protein
MPLQADLPAGTFVELSALPALSNSRSGLSDNRL